jgi:DNA-directed RNA polymerase specialized sigma24 family protein
MWNGTESEFEQIIQEYKNALYGTAFAYLSSNSEIDDVVQETFIEFYYKYDTIRDKTKIGAWLCWMILIPDNPPKCS